MPKERCYAARWYAIIISNALQVYFRRAAEQSSRSAGNENLSLFQPIRGKNKGEYIKFEH